MSSRTAGPENRLRFREKRDILDGKAQSDLKHIYGRGVYVNDIHETSEGDLVISLGNSVPKNVSDSIEQDAVMQFVNIRDIYALNAESTGEGYYVIDLPDRDDVYEGFVDRRDQIISSLDWSMARAIYENVFELSSVKTQLTPIIQIIRWTHNNPGIEIKRIRDAQNSANTNQYLDVLSDLGFLDIEEGRVEKGEMMNAIYLTDANEDYVKAVIGNVIKKGYNVLTEQHDLGMLAHYPKYSNAYYYSAFQKDDPELHLDVDTIARNYADQYDEEPDPLVVNDKLDDLAEAGVVTKEEQHVSANRNVYSQVGSEARLEI